MCQVSWHWIRQHVSSRPCRRPANCHRHLGTFVRFNRHLKAIIHEYLSAQAYTFNLVQLSCHICLHDLLCARVVDYIRKGILGTSADTDQRYCFC